MLDIHDAHHAANSWKDFFIHIATIVIGLIIAVGLEQTVEAIHQRHQRAELREDLRAEARQRIHRLDENQKSNTNDLAWYREFMRAGREAQVAGGFVTFTVPPKKRLPAIADATNGVWTSAKASGVVAVLPSEEIELWDAADGDRWVTEHSGKDFIDREDALKIYFGIFERLGLSPNPGTTLRLTIEDRDRLMSAVANIYEATWQLQRDDAYWKGTTQGVLDGAKTTDDLIPYALRSLAELPK
jgi:hypothetical protein